jgi:tetratricopeptide (TPR) repeat protein
VNRQQSIIAIAAVSIVLLLFLFGRTKPISEKAEAPVASGNQHSAGKPALGFEEMLNLSKKKLTPTQLKMVNNWEAAILSAGNTEKIHYYHLLSDYWKDSVGAFVPYIKYLSESAKLENSDKNLTFAAHLMLAELPAMEDPALQKWMAIEARSLFEKANVLNPNNDSTLIGLGSCYFFGAGENEPPMKGIALIREVAEKKPENIYAQYMLGVGATVSGQTDKAIERFTKVVSLDQNNIEARLRLADLFAQKGDKANAKIHYTAFIQAVKRLESAGKFKSNPEMIRQIEVYIETLK